MTTTAASTAATAADVPPLNTTSLSSETTVVAPYQAVEVEVTYVPSELDADQTATVKLAHEALGEYEYVCTGRGTRPGVMDEHRPSALVGDPQSYMFNFRNPFDAPIDVDVAPAATFAGDVRR